MLTAIFWIYSYSSSTNNSLLWMKSIKAYTVFYRFFIPPFGKTRLDILFLQFLSSSSPPSPPQSLGKQFKAMSSTGIFVSYHSHGALYESFTHCAATKWNLVIRASLPISGSSSNLFQLFILKSSKTQRRWKDRGNKAAAFFHWWKQRRKGKKNNNCSQNLC